MFCLCLNWGLSEIGDLHFRDVISVLLSVEGCLVQSVCEILVTIFVKGEVREN